MKLLVLSSLSGYPLKAPAWLPIFPPKCRRKIFSTPSPVGQWESAGDRGSEWIGTLSGPISDSPAPLPCSHLIYGETQGVFLYPSPPLYPLTDAGIGTDTIFSSFLDGRPPARPLTQRDARRGPPFYLFQHFTTFVMYSYASSTVSTTWKSSRSDASMA